MNKLNNNTYFVVTVDTESDDAWKKPEVISLENLREIPRFQELCEKYEIIPTYLLAYEFAARDEAVSVLKPIADAGRCEIGHHLHVWSSPPFQRKSKTGDIDMKWLHSYQFELPDSLFDEKATALKEMIKQNYGKNPTSHRAGRWGIDKRTINWLGNNNFLVDTSIVPFMNLFKDHVISNNECRLIYNRKNPSIWKLSGNKNVTEIPVTVNIPKYFINYLSFVTNKFYLKIINKINWSKMLRPDPTYPISYYSQIIKDSIKRDIKIINMMLHSSELSFGCSPFTQSKASTNLIWRALEETFQTVRNNNIISEKISNIKYHST